MTDSIDGVPPKFWQRWLRNVFGLDTRSLAVFRILIGILLLIDLYDRSLYFTDFYTDDGFLTRTVVGEYLSQMHPPSDKVDVSSMPLPFWSFHLLSGEAWVAQLLFVLQAICALAFLFGWKTRLFTFLTWLLLISLHVRNPVVLNSGDTLMRMMLFWGIFLPLGSRWSLDRLLERDPKILPSLHLSIAGAAFIIQLCFMYWFTGLSKFNETWLQGQAIENVLNLNLVCRPWGKPLLEYPGFLAVMCHVTLWLEIAVPFLLFVPWKTAWIRTALIVTFLGFHLGIVLTMAVGLFSAISMTCWLALLPSAFWNSRWVRGIAAGVLGSPTLLGDEDDEDLAAWAGHDRGPWVQSAYWGVQAVCGGLLVYVLLWNIWRVSPDDPRLSRLVPPAIRPLGQSLMIAQEFKMFDTPPAVDYWFAYEARLKNGDLVDLFTGQPTRELEKPEDVYSRYRDHRWRRLHVNLLHPDYVVLREPITRFLIKRWNESHSADFQVTRCLFRCYQERTGPEDEPGNLNSFTWVDIQLESTPFEDLFRAIDNGGSFLP